MANLVDLERREDHIAVITLNRPDVMNALSVEMMDELSDAIHQADHADDIYCTILTASGKAFCAGADLKERKEMTDDQVIQTVQKIGHLATAIENMKSPVIAAINGAMFGGGMELALACDLRVAVSHASMGLTETSLAIIPGAGGTQRLPRLIGMGEAKKMIYTAKRISSEEGLTMGLIEQVTDDGDLFKTALEMAQEISSNGPVAIQQAKTAINKGMETDIATGLVLEHACYKATIPTSDRMEGLQAFQEKRQPNYQGK